MVLVAVVMLVFFFTQRASVFLPKLVRVLIPFLRYFTRFDGCVLFSVVALTRRFNKRSVYHLPSLSHISLRRQLLMKLLKKLFNKIEIFRRSRNSQIVLASGTLLSSCSPKNRMNESLSLIWYSNPVIREIMQLLKH